MHFSKGMYKKLIAETYLLNNQPTNNGTVKNSGPWQSNQGYLVRGAGADDGDIDGLARPINLNGACHIAGATNERRKNSR